MCDSGVARLGHEVTVIDLLSQQKFEEALQTTQDVQEKSQQVGLGPSMAKHCQHDFMVGWAAGCEENAGNYTRVVRVGINLRRIDWHVPLKRIP